jgi:hypothetical protein
MLANIALLLTVATVATLELITTTNRKASVATFAGLTLAALAYLTGDGTGPALALVAVGGLTATSKMPGGSFSLQARKTCPTGSKLAEIPGTPCFKCFADERGAYAWPMVIQAQIRRFEILQEAIADKAKAAQWVTAFADHLNGKVTRAQKRLAKHLSAWATVAEQDQDIALWYRFEAASARCSAGAKRIVKGGDATKEKTRCQELAAAYEKAAAAWEDLKTNKPARAKALDAWRGYENSRYFRWHDSGDIFDPRYLAMILQVADRTPKVNHWLPTQERAMVTNSIKARPMPPNIAVRISSPKLDQHIKQKAPGLLASSVTTDGTTTGILCPAYNQGGTCGPCRACWAVSVPLATYPQH